MSNAIIGKLGEDGEIRPTELNPDKADEHIEKLKQVVTEAIKAGENLTQEEIRKHQSGGYVDAIPTMIIPPEEK